MSTNGDESSGPHDLPEEAKVGDLLPPDVEPYDPPSKKIAERRVGGWKTSSRLFQRRVFRPAGNSRRFWKKIEEDDPFLPKPTGKRIAQEGGHALYPADRLVRMPEAPRATRPTEQAAPPPQPKRVAQPPPRPAYTEEPTPPPQPRSVPPRRPTPAPPPQAQPEQPVIDRRPPRLPHPNERRPSGGRMSAAPQRSRQGNVHHRLADKSGRTATEVRKEKEAWRDKATGPKAPPPLRGIDDILSILGDLKASQELHEAGVTGTTSADVVSTPTPRPKPRPAPAPQPRPAPPPPQPPPVDRTPPKPKAPAAPINRSPSGRSGGGLDDLFGGGPNEGRMRIPRRSKRPAGSEDDEGSG